MPSERLTSSPRSITDLVNMTESGPCSPIALRISRALASTPELERLVGLVLLLTRIDAGTKGFLAACDDQALKGSIRFHFGHDLQDLDRRLLADRVQLVRPVNRHFDPAVMLF